MDLVDPTEFLISSLDAFFSDSSNKKMMTRVLYNECMSLRTLDWFVSNYSKKNNVIYFINESCDSEDKLINHKIIDGDTPHDQANVSPHTEFFTSRGEISTESRNYRMFNVFLEYKSQLKSYSKKWFDPFCRGDRLEYIDCEGRMFYTTIGQLNFFRWALKNNIINYCLKHVDTIEDDMMETVRLRKDSDDMAKRRELSRAAIKKCNKQFTKITIRFD